MLFRSKKFKDETGIISAQGVGENIQFNHYQNVSGAINLAQELKKDPNKGFTKGRKFQLIGVVPESEAYRNSGLLEKGAMLKFLKSEAGDPYRTVSKSSL